MTSKKLQAVLEKMPQTGFHFDQDNHIYALDGKPLTGVTTILQVIAKPALIQWSADEAVKHLGWFNEKYVEDKEKAMSEFYELYAQKFGTITPYGFYQLLCEARTQHAKRKKDAWDIGTLVHKEVEEVIKSWIVGGTPPMTTVTWIKDEKVAKIVQQFCNWACENNVKFIESEIRLFSKDWWVAGTADIVCEINGKKFIGDVKTGSAIYPEMYIQTAAYAKMLHEMNLHTDIEGVIIINCKKDGGFQVETSYGLDDKIKAFEAALTLYRFAESYKNLT